MATNTNLDTNSKPSPSVYVEDMEEVRRVFDKFDANGDGRISFTELVDVMKALGSQASTLDDLKQMMEEIDTDHDGFISLDEFADFFKDSADGEPPELKEAFELYDQDKNGLISAEELHQILSRLGEKCSVDDCATMIKSVDSDGDGYVSFDEFKKMMGNTAAAAASNGLSM